MQSVSFYDLKEFARFAFSGFFSTMSNLVTVVLATEILSYDRALLLGIIVGAIVSYIITKLFVFKSKTWSASTGWEGLRFTLVFTASSIIYYFTAYYVGTLLVSQFGFEKIAHAGGVLAGSGVMLFSSYFGHRYFTY